MMKKGSVIIFLFLVFITCPVSAQEQHPGMVRWNGYSQLRFTSDFDSIHSFSMRRMKLWLTGSPGFSDHWNFKIQTTLSSNHNETFLLQDVFTTYHANRLKIKMGQFVPAFSLQRFQPDYSIPMVERSAVVNALIPGASLGVRDIGVEGHYSGPCNKWQTWLGIFNGNGIKNYRLDYQGLLLSQKSEVSLFNNHLQAGYSLAYRKADKLQLTSILPDSVRFSGNDLRYNIFALYRNRHWQIQAEYLRADLGAKTADGYYILSSLECAKNQFSVSWNTYNDMIKSTDNGPYIHLDYNRLLNGEKLKLMFDNGIRVNNGSLHEQYAAVQLQLFFN